MKRTIDILVSLFGLLITAPILLVFMYLVYRQDKHSPFYFAPRVGKDNHIFTMVKLRSMKKNADKSGVDSTSANDKRITKVGHLIRKYKLDEITQLWNVLKGDMSLVGPRPNVKNETDNYTEVEKKLLSIKPGITDFSSIVFSDEGEILRDQKNPDLAYNQLIRPWKSRLGIIYIENRSTILDLQLIFYTVIAIISKASALKWINNKLSQLNVDELVIQISARTEKLTPYPPPGADVVVSDDQQTN